MKQGKKIFFIALMLMLGSIDGIFAEEQSFREIKFEGLKNISKYEIIKEAGIRVTSEEILADTDILRKALIENPLVDSFEIEHGGALLAITLSEKRIIACAAVTVQNATVPILVGEDFTVLSVAKTADIPGPLFIVASSEVIGNEMSVKFKDVCTLVKRAGEEYPLLYGEVEEVELLAEGDIEIKLKARSSRCRMRAIYHNLKRLNYVLGYMDASGLYTDFFEIDGDSVVIK